MEDYGFEYSDEEPEEQDVDIENQYYNSKGFFLKFMLLVFLASIFWKLKRVKFAVRLSISLWLFLFGVITWKFRIWTSSEVWDKLF